MTAPDWRFPDIEDVLVVLLEQVTGDPARTGTETPADLDKKLPFIRVQRRGGFSDRLFDYATVDIDCFHTTYRTGVKPLAEQVRQFLTTRTHRLDAAVIDRIDCTAAPAEQPWAPGMRRLLATYQTVARRHRSDS